MHAQFAMLARAHAAEDASWKDAWRADYHFRSTLRVDELNRRRRVQA